MVGQEFKHNTNMFSNYRGFSGYTYMVVWVGGLEVWEIRVLCNIHYKI